MKIVTHDGLFHADDVYCTAALLILHPDAKVIRSRDPKVIADGDAVFDVGGRYDPSQGYFDHHQNDFNATRPSGIPFSSFGLVWAAMGSSIIKKSLEALYGDDEFFGKIDSHLNYMVSHIDDKIVIPIDILDSGYGTYPLKVGSAFLTEHKASTLSEYVSRQNKPWWLGSPEDNYKWFVAAVNNAKKDLQGLIEDSFWFQKVRKEVIHKVKQAHEGPDPKILVLEKFLPGVITHLWSSELESLGADIHFILYPESGNWRIMGTQATRHDRFTQKTSLPAEWAGLSGDALVEASGFEDAIFVHRGRHIGGFVTQESALKVAQTLVLSGRISPRVDLAETFGETKNT